VLVGIKGLKVRPNQAMGAFAFPIHMQVMSRVKAVAVVRGFVASEACVRHGASFAQLAD
jgi:stage V sporulation protein SpoVS